MTDEPDIETTGIRNPGQPDQWLVPPWSPESTAREVVRHFSRFHPRQNLLRCVARSAASAEAEHQAGLKDAQQRMQLTLVRTLGLNCRPIPGQAG